MSINFFNVKHFWMLKFHAAVTSVLFKLELHLSCAEWLHCKWFFRGKGTQTAHLSHTVVTFFFFLAFVFSWMCFCCCCKCMWVDYILRERERERERERISSEREREKERERERERNIYKRQSGVPIKSFPSLSTLHSQGFRNTHCPLGGILLELHGMAAAKMNCDIVNFAS